MGTLAVYLYAFVHFTGNYNKNIDLGNLLTLEETPLLQSIAFIYHESRSIFKSNDVCHWSIYRLHDN